MPYWKPISYHICMLLQPVPEVCSNSAGRKQDTRDMCIYTEVSMFIGTAEAGCTYKHTNLCVTVFGYQMVGNASIKHMHFMKQKSTQ